MLKLKLKNSEILPMVVHLAVWIGVFSLPLFFVPRFNAKHDEQLNTHIIWMFDFLLLLLFYANYFIYIPKLLIKRKFLLYFITVIATIVGIYYFHNLINDLFLAFSPNMEEHTRHRRGIVPLLLLAWAISTGIKMTAEWLRNERQKTELEKEKLSTELAFLKSQINPHFFFNVLNNICSLARKKSDETEKAIIKLSQLMRYNFYDFKDDRISMEKEVEYLKDYIDLQRLRLTDNVSINFVVKGEFDKVVIPPMLFIPFVENAFKHGINTYEDCFIDFYLEASEKSVTFLARNKQLNEKQVNENHGIGLKNVCRRLDLLYPGHHQLHITDDGPEYIVDLKIKLN